MRAHSCCNVIGRPQAAWFEEAGYTYQTDKNGKKKLKHAVKIPKTISARDLLQTAEVDDVYELVAVLYHKGLSVDSGHYIANVCDYNTKDWWKCDDSTVTKIDQDELLKVSRGSGDGDSEKSGGKCKGGNGKEKGGKGQGEKGKGGKGKGKGKVVAGKKKKATEAAKTKSKKRGRASKEEKEEKKNESAAASATIDVDGDDGDDGDDVTVVDGEGNTMTSM